MPKSTALALSIACTAVAGGLLIGGWMVPGMTVLAASLAFDILFVRALRAEKKERS
jgi:uncharacterized protein (DUF58 family)